MAPSKFQCLNAVKTVSRKGPSKAGFSTSRAARAEYIPRPPPPRNNSSYRSGDIEGESSKGHSFNGRIQLPRNFDRRPQPGNANSTARLANLMANNNRRKTAAADHTSPSTSTTSEDVAKNTKAASLTRQITRRFTAGDVYAPHDLSAVEMMKWQPRGRPLNDAFDALNLNPMDHYRNFSMLSEYMTPMGRIKHSKETGLRPVNQRRIARTIRRAIGMGIMPSVHRHPEILHKLLLKSQRMVKPMKGYIGS